MFWYSSVESRPWLVDAPEACCLPTMMTPSIHNCVNIFSHFMIGRAHTLARTRLNLHNVASMFWFLVLPPKTSVNIPWIMSASGRAIIMGEIRQSAALWLRQQMKRFHVTDKADAFSKGVIFIRKSGDWYLLIYATQRQRWVCDECINMFSASFFGGEYKWWYYPATSPAPNISQNIQTNDLFMCAIFGWTMAAGPSGSRQIIHVMLMHWWLIDKRVRETCLAQFFAIFDPIDSISVISLISIIFQFSRPDEELVFSAGQECEHNSRHRIPLYNFYVKICKLS